MVIRYLFFVLILAILLAVILKYLDSILRRANVKENRFFKWFDRKNKPYVKKSKKENIE